MSASVKVGMISRNYRSAPFLEACHRFDNLELIACADHREPDDLKLRCQQFGIPVLTVEELLDIPEIEIVINATHTKAHCAFALAIIAAGKNVYNRTPFVAEPGEGRRVLDFAREKDVIVGSEPDAFLSNGVQVCRKLISEGVIGQPVFVNAFMVQRNIDGRHPDQDFYYPHAAGVMYLLGPYCLSTLVYLLGPVSRVVGSQCIRPLQKFDEQPNQIFLEDVPTHVAGSLEFANGINGTIITGFETGTHSHSVVEIYGTEGALRLPDPTTFDENVQVRKLGEKDWTPVPISSSDLPQCRGIGLADMAEALKDNRPHLASGELALHVIDIIWSIHQSAKLGKSLAVKSAVSPESV
ncbi:MAG: Gfo/Idh/MocA family oxidoreductase [Chloroflexi bacterium]|nr:Gfo/Idh/MocA family oxidoreductase [Chloroflexota bacterium]